MFIDDIKSLILSNKEIVAVTDRGLEDCKRHVIFIATNLLKRYPELAEVIKLRDGIVDEGKVVKEVKKSKKK